MRIEDDLRATYRALESSAPTREDLRRSLASRTTRGRSHPWTVPLLACAVVLALLVAPTLLVDYRHTRSAQPTGTVGLSEAPSAVGTTSLDQWASIALKQARLLGDPSPSSAQIAKTTLAGAAALHDRQERTINAAEPVYAMVIFGHFTCFASCLTAPGVNTPTGSRAVLTFDLATDAVIGVSLDSRDTDLSSIAGHVDLPLITVERASPGATNPPVASAIVAQLVALAIEHATDWSDPHPTQVRAVLATEAEMNHELGYTAYGSRTPVYIVAEAGHFACTPPSCVRPRPIVPSVTTSATGTQPMPMSYMVFTVAPDGTDGESLYVGRLDPDLANLGTVIDLQPYVDAHQ